MVGRTVPLHGKERAGCETHHQHLWEKLHKDLLCAAAKSGSGGRPGKGESQNYTAQLLCGCICFMKACKDVQMGAPSWHVLVTQRLCSGWRPPSPSCVTKANAPELSARARSRSGPRYPGCAAPQLTCLDTAPFHLHSMSCAHLSTKLWKVLGENRSACISKRRNLCFSPGRLLFIYFCPPLPEVPRQGVQGPQSPWPQLGLGAASPIDGHPPRTDGVSHKTSTAHPAEFIVAGTLLQDAGCSDK